MKRRGVCPVCGNRFTLKKRGKLPSHVFYGGFTKAVECTGSGKVVTP